MVNVVAILGPTATGKSHVALEVAQRFGGEIINADALQVYRGFDVGTAKPTPAEQRRVPHHLIDILDPHERYSAGEFARRARRVIEELGKRGRSAVVVGGSGLYLRALLEGISPVPPGDPEVRRALRRRLESEGLESLRAELRGVDPETAARLAPGDTQRVLRALEVARVSGEPLAAFIRRRPFGSASLPASRIGLTLPRSILYDRIERRAIRMFEAGWVEEVRELLRRGLHPDLPAFQAIGYRQIAHHLLDDWPYSRTVEETVRATRRFAKRQLTWFRKEQGVTWFTAPDLERCTLQIVDHLRCSGAGGELDA